MSDAAVPQGAIPVDQFQPAPVGQPSANNAATQAAIPAGAVPIDQFESHEDYYGAPGQQLKAGLEGVSKGLIGSTLTDAAETKLLGVKPEDIAAREEENPVTSGVGQAVGFGTGMLTGVGEAAVAGKVGEAALGLTKAGQALRAGASELPMAARVGSEALKQAAEMAVIGSDDVLAKKLFTQPDLSAEQAIGEVGLSAALGGVGGAFMSGVASPLWKATVGPKVEGFLSTLSGKLGGMADPAITEASDLAAKAGVDLSQYPAVAAKINGDPTADQLFSKLSQTDTTGAGRKVQEELGNFHSEVGGQMGEALGRDPASIEGLESKLDKYTRGNDIANTLHDELTKVAKPISDAYDKVNATFKASPISEESRRVAADTIAQVAMDKGWYKSADETSKNLMEKVLNKLPEQQTAEDLKQFITNLREAHPFGSSGYGAARDISNALKDAQERAVMSGIMDKGGTEEGGKLALAQYRELKGQYAKLMGTMDDLDTQLHVGKYYGPQSFLNNLKEKGTTDAESILNRLSGSNKAGTLDMLQQFPETLSKVKQYHADQLLSTSRSASGSLDPRKLMRNMDKLSPQIKALIADPGTQERLKALGELVERTGDPTHNWSNTARTVDKLTHGTPSPLTLMAALFGHGAASLLAHVGGLGIKEGTDAVRYGMLKFLGSNKPISAPGFKAAIEFMDRTIKGESALNKGIKAVFQTGALKLSSEVSKKDLEKLDKQVANGQQDQGKEAFQNIVDSPMSHYLPDHHMAAAATTAQAVNYLKTLRPDNTPAHPLDKKLPVPASQTARYQRALTIAQQPTAVLSHIKNGTLQISDIQDLSTMYPKLYQEMQGRLTQAMVNQHADGAAIPYRTKMGLSLFLQTPLDATMTPQAIMAAQPKPMQSPQAQSAKNGSKNHSRANMGKDIANYRTPVQGAEADRGNRES